MRQSQATQPATRPGSPRLPRDCNLHAVFGVTPIAVPGSSSPPSPWWASRSPPTIWLLLVPVALHGIGNGITIPSILTMLTELAPPEFRAAFMSINGREGFDCLTAGDRARHRGGAAGRPELAVANYEESVALTPHNGYRLRMLGRRRAELAKRKRRPI